MFKFLIKHYFGRDVLFTTKYNGNWQRGTIAYQNDIVILTDTSIYDIKDIKHIKLL